MTETQARPETLTEYLLRVRPETEAEMEAALLAVAIDMAAAQTLQRDARALDDQRVDLVRRHAHTKVIDRISVDLRLLRRALEHLEVDP